MTSADDTHQDPTVGIVTRTKPGLAIPPIASARYVVSDARAQVVGIEDRYTLSTKTFFATPMADIARGHPA